MAHFMFGLESPSLSTDAAVRERRVVPRQTYDIATIDIHYSSVLLRHSLTLECESERLYWPHIQKMK